MHECTYTQTNTNKPTKTQTRNISYIKRPLRFKTKTKQNKTNPPKAVLDHKKEGKKKKSPKIPLRLPFLYMLNSLSHRILKTFVQNASFYKTRREKLTLSRTGL